MGEHHGVPYCLAFGTVRTSVSSVRQRDKMSRKKPGKFAIHHAEFTTLFRLDPSHKIEANQGQSSLIKVNQGYQRCSFYDSKWPETGLPGDGFTPLHRRSLLWDKMAQL
jgi:hypothetical protein